MTDTNTGPGHLDEGRGADEGFLASYLPFLLHRSYQLLSETFHSGLAEVGLDITECLLTRSVGPGDKRQRIFELTADGQAESRRLMDVSQEALVETLERTSVDPVRLKAMLKHLIGDLERRRPSLDQPRSWPMSKG